MLDPNIFNTLFVFPILNLLAGFYKIFLLLKIPGAFGFAIIALTFFVRLLLHPFFHQQIQTTKKMQDLKPHLDKLGHKHKDDPKKLQQEQMRLYQEAGINPASGCLFMVIQLPIFFALYNTLNLFLHNVATAKIISQINHILYFPFLKINTIDPWFFGFNLGLSPQQAGHWYYYLIPVVTGVLQYFQAAATMPPQNVEEKPKDSSGQASKKKDDKENKTSTSEEFQKAMATQTKYIFPFMIAWFSFSLPVGLSLYWNIFSLFSIMQYQRVNKNSKLEARNPKQ